MITLWISASLLALTGWQGYRLGKEYGWWSKTSPLNTRKKAAALPTNPDEPEGSGLGRSKTDFSRLLDGFTPMNGESAQSQQYDEEEREHYEKQAIIEPTTTLMAADELSYGTEYPDETDQIPETCTWMDDEEVMLVNAEAGEVPNGGQPVVALNEYVTRVRTVQRKMNQLTKRRKADNSFVKQELGVLIETYQLENDQSLEWLFQQHETTTHPDYGSLFDRIESLAA